MFRVNAATLDSYLDFDPIRKIDLQKLDKLLKQSAPGLKRYFHKGTPAFGAVSLISDKQG